MAARSGWIAAPGGVLIQDAQGTIIGAVGISGDTDKDDLLRHVEAAAGLVADTGEVA